MYGKENIVTVTSADRVRVMFTVHSVEALRKRMRIGQKVLATHEVMDGKACVMKQDVVATVVGLYPHLARVRYMTKYGPRYQCLSYAQILTERRLVR